MKKLIFLLLILVMAVGCLASCKNAATNSVPTGDTVADTTPDSFAETQEPFSPTGEVTVEGELDDGEPADTLSVSTDSEKGKYGEIH